jgi:hypothetical protein
MHANRMASKKGLWAGRIMSAVAILFLAFDATVKLLNVAPVIEANARLGYPPSAILPIGIIELVCAIVYAIPASSILGAVLLTGYLGGAVATHFRIGSPLLTHSLFPVYVATLLWGGLFLRNTRLRVLLPGRRRSRPRRIAQRSHDSSGRRFIYGLWTVQTVLALLFLFAGATKLIMSADVLASMNSASRIALPVGFLRFIGAVEVLGALGLVLPGLFGIRETLTPLAAAGLVIIMIGATATTLANGDVAPALFPFAVGLLSTFVAVGRWRSNPERSHGANLISLPAAQ